MTESGKGNRLGRRLAAALQAAGGFRLLLFGLILLYCWVFTGLAFNQHAGMRNTNLMALGMSILFVLLMLVVMWRVAVAHRNNAEPV